MPMIQLENKMWLPVGRLLICSNKSSFKFVTLYMSITTNEYSRYTPEILQSDWLRALPTAAWMSDFTPVLKLHKLIQKYTRMFKIIPIIIPIIQKHFSAIKLSLTMKIVEPNPTLTLLSSQYIMLYIILSWVAHKLYTTELDWGD